MKHSTNGKLCGFLSGFANASHVKRVVMGTWEALVLPPCRGMRSRSEERRSKENMGVRSFHSTLSVGKPRTRGRERSYIVAFKGNINSLDRLIN